ncbi:MAG: formate dehydrogenase subunit alpha [Alphaproteobacteria bacterium]|jgi:formate dehydrogenase major subunit|tara:strand:+ start:212 stop:2986 length:2775 start_codon:yes stop_codon:yes gene_type:complete
MSDLTLFKIDGKEYKAEKDETIWQVATKNGIDIPHLCYSDEPGYRADGNCRTCMVEIKGERTLAASCIRKPTEGMEITVNSERAKKSRSMVFELLVADQPKKEISPDPDSKFWKWSDKIGVTESRFPPKEKISLDQSHTAMSVNLDACINCGLCVRACREVQVNDVIGMAFRGSTAKIIFDLDDPMGESTCVACGECVQACPTGALLETTLVDQEGKRNDLVADKKVESVCPYCGVGCQTEVSVKDDKILHIDGKNGPANENRLCVKGRFGFDYINHEGRLTKPLIRKKTAPKKWDANIDDKNIYDYFEETTWENALDIAANGFTKTFNEEGPKGLAGFGSAKCSNEEAYLFQKLVRVGFGSNNVDHCTRLCHASSVAALFEGVKSGAVSAPFNAATIADCIIVIGARPTENHPVAATYLKRAAKRGAKIIVMDPRKQGLSKYAEHNLQFKAGTDVAMLNAMLHTIINENLYDEQYVQGQTEGFEELKENIKDFSPEKMEAVCGIKAETLKEVARLYATSEKSIIFWGMGVSQHVHGTDNARCLIALALSTGQIGREGTGLHPLRGQNNVQGASDAGLIPWMYPDYQVVDGKDNQNTYEKFWGKEMDPKRGLTVVEIIHAIHDDQIKAMYIMGENPAMSDPDQKHARQALAKLEHLVVQDIFLTETAWHADVILPSSAHAEKTGTYTNTNRTVQMGRQVVPPPGDARQDWWITQAIATRMGLDWSYLHPSDVFNEMCQIMDSLKNITWERLDKENAITYPCEAPDSSGSEYIFRDSFPTANGRGKIVPARLIPPAELPDDEFPLILTTGRLLEHWHTGSMTRRATVLDHIEPEAIVSMNRWDMKRMDINPGDQVQVKTKRGSIVIKVRSDKEIPEGMVFIPFCFAEAAANVLTNPQLDPYGKIPEFKFSAASVLKTQSTTHQTI